MSKWSCSCGARMDDHKCPDDNYYRVFSDEDWNNISTDEKGNLNLYEDIPTQTYDVYRCPKCGRLMVFGDNGCISVYKKEES